MRHSVLYTLLFSAGLCVLCAVMVSSSAVTLKEEQEANKVLDRQLNVLEAAGLIAAGEKPAGDELAAKSARLEAVLVDLATGEEAEGDTQTYDQQKAKKDPARSRAVESNPARVNRVPELALVYKVLDDSGALDKVVLPIEGYGLWGTLYGYLALDDDTDTVVGITYYEHKETPGLGGEVDNPRWKALWPGREVFDDSWQPALEVVKGLAPPASEAPLQVDGLSGATITSRGITNMLDFWLGPDGFGPYLEKLRLANDDRPSAERSAA